MTGRGGRVAVVTGAARGIGAATALRLACDGMTVAVLDVDGHGCADTVRRITGLGGKALAVQADVTVAAEVADAISRVADGAGPPVVLVNNAGIIRDRPFGEMPEHDWAAVIDVNLRGPFLMCQAVRPHIVAEGWGRIVNLSSVAALGNRDQANYSAAKAGVQGLTRTLAIELGPFGATVNAVAPGYIVTDMTAAMADRLGMDFEKLQRMVAAQTPVRRVGTPQDVAHAISFLVSEDAGYISGEVIHITGGPLR
ncbi:MAG TPA: 3-oxoacyl-ACP reductase FabG [Streptosporangiaceae bacterium]